MNEKTAAVYGQKNNVHNCRCCDSRAFVPFISAIWLRRPDSRAFVAFATPG
ncbi:MULTISPECIES: hypothetical protein [unclassified Paenibacillus]|uniref:hypothetical protein n=1 Tax=unclassified Paenibacillus TaxID=185978 RepID=UPI002406A26D|nr:MULTISPECIES: hypothetical protein [unclassified Paenibacillus]MDF9841575.1 hypothetical protein [Paenibacillus sp. PastF-2]MDF9848313.1 hypothetical protein [Paenibacillus sp. PastM-2]MDF9854734.1 hypothetical protein [Paenibacillus sp. PastF-1]MDH6480004.1 hypothetical protein [Paenibacillus sp. PastH-2]